MKPALPRWLSGAVLLLALAGPSAARADEKAAVDAARTAFNEASALAARGQWNAACDLYARSLSLHPAPLTRYSLGVAQREAGRLVAARASFDAFVAEPVSSTTQVYVEPARSAIAELGGRVATITLVLVPGTLPGTEVTVDGVAVPRGSLAGRRAVDPGLHAIVARAPGRLESRAHVTLPEGGAATLTLILAPLPQSAPGAPIEAPSTSAFGPLAAAPAGRQAPWPTVLPVVLLAAGGAALAGGVALGLVGLADARGAGSATGPAADDARAKGLAGDVIAGTGIAAATVGLVLLLVQRTYPVSASAQPWIKPGGAGFGVSF